MCCKSYQRRFRYMLVDEYQDTNVAQYLWLRLLAQGHRNICCVGDDDQSIYGWRGAEVDNILRFEKDFPGARVIRLERNYRSTPHILAAASGLIARNEGRLGKTLRTDMAEGEKLVVRGHWDGDEEARAIGDDIENLQRKGHPLADIAILVRASFQMRAFEDRFITLGLPYRVIGGPRFYERQEIRDALAYFKVAASPDNDLAFERIVNLPKRGIGDATLKHMHMHARASGVSLYRAAEALALTDEFSARTRTALAGVLQSFARWRSLVDGLSHIELAEIILDESGYTAMWQNERSPEAQGRLENLKELVRSMGEFESMAGFLEHIALVMDTDGAETNDRINVMTLHSAKGLEFRTVFLPGWEEGLFPAPALARREGPPRPRGGAPPGLCRHHPGQGAHHHLLRPEPPHARQLAARPALAVHRGAAGGQRRGRGDVDELRRLRAGHLRRLALRRTDAVRQHLCHARLAARQEGL